MSEFTPSNKQRDSEDKSITTKERVLGGIGLATAAGLLLAGGWAIDKAGSSIRDQDYKKAAGEAVEIYDNLVPEDFLRCQPVGVEVGPTMSILGDRENGQTQTILFEADFTPGDKIQTPLFSDHGKDVGGQNIEMNWSSQAPFEVNSYGETGSGINRKSFSRITEDYRGAERDNDGKPITIYDQLMRPDADIVRGEFLIPIEVGGDGETTFSLQPAIRTVFLSGVDEKVIAGPSEAKIGFIENKTIKSPEPCAEIVMQVQDGAVTSVELR